MVPVIYADLSALDSFRTHLSFLKTRCFTKYKMARVRKKDIHRNMRRWDAASDLNACMRQVCICSKHSATGRISPDKNTQ